MLPSNPQNDSANPEEELYRIHILNMLTEDTRSSAWTTKEYCAGQFKTIFEVFTKMVGQHVTIGDDTGLLGDDQCFVVLHKTDERDTALFVISYYSKSQYKKIEAARASLQEIATREKQAAAQAPRHKIKPFPKKPNRHN